MPVYGAEFSKIIMTSSIVFLRKYMDQRILTFIIEGRLLYSLDQHGQYLNSIRSCILMRTAMQCTEVQLNDLTVKQHAGYSQYYNSFLMQHNKV